MRERKSCRLIKNSGRTFFPKRQQGEKETISEATNKVPRVALPADNLLLPLPQHLGDWYPLLIERKRLIGFCSADKTHPKCSVSAETHIVLANNSFGYKTASPNKSSSGAALRMSTAMLFLGHAL